MHPLIAKRLFWVLLSGMICGWPAAPVVAQADAGDDAEAVKVPATFGARLIQLTQVVLDHHIDPPTRQEMVMHAVRELYEAGGQPVPRGLSGRISAISDPKELAALVDEAADDDDRSIPARAMHRLLGNLPGTGRLMDSVDLKVQGQLSANQYVGTGIALGMDRDAKRPVMTKVFYDGPAWKAGARDGELILAVGDEDSGSMSLVDVVRLLRGEAGSEVEVVLQQPGQKKRTVTITRNVAFIPTVAGYRQKSPAQWQYTVDSARQVAYVRIGRIGSSTLPELRQVERRLLGREVTSLILDLRFGGGSLHDTILIADALLEKGKIGQVRSLEGVTKYDAKPGPVLFRGMRMAVLVDRVANADREFLAAALQDNKRDRGRRADARSGICSRSRTVTGLGQVARHSHRRPPSG